jgi:integrase
MSARAPRIPSYRRHSSGQARVTLDGKDHLLGVYGSAESKEAYRRLIAEWAERKGSFAPKADGPAPLSVNELILAYYKHVTGHDGLDAARSRGDAYCLRDALRVVKALYGLTPAQGFGPLALKACRTHMIGLTWSRSYVNAQIGRVRRAFRWAVGEEMIPPAVWEALRAVDGLRRGQSAAPEAPGVRSVDVAHVEAALPHMPAPVAAMVRLQLHSGMRAGEVMSMRDADVDATGPVWCYRPHRHKNTHRGKDRVAFLGPKAQEVLRPWLPVLCPGCGARDLPGRLGWTGELCAACHDRREEGAPIPTTAPATTAPPSPRYLFSPRAYVEDLHARRAAARKTKRTPSEQKKKRKARPKVLPGERYTRRSYRVAVCRACTKASVPPWSPLQLRHTAATLIRKRFGVEGAQGVLGHSRVETTQVYAERLLGEAARIMAAVG